jgi:hypothetical protein
MPPVRYYPSSPNATACAFGEAGGLHQLLKFEELERWSDPRAKNLGIAWNSNPCLVCNQPRGRTASGSGKTASMIRL